METDLPIANRRIKELMDKLVERGKKIILISDMYLPAEVITQMLKRCGVDCYEKLYVSSEFASTKHDSSLFKHVLEDLDITPGDIFHIGDNKHSDHDVPESLGIASYRIRRPIDDYFSTHKDEYRFYGRKKTLERSIIVSMDMINGMSDDIWYDIGKRFGGPLVTSFSIRINEGSESADACYLYASRDGYNVKRIADELYPDRRTRYAFTQRLILDVLTDKDIPYGHVEIPDKHKDRYRYERTRAAVRRALGFFRDDLKITIPEDDKEMFGLYRSHIDEIDRLRKDRLKDYSDYLNDMCQSYDIHLIDCTTMKFSSQRLLESIIGRDVKGHYLVTLSDSDERYESMFDWRRPIIGWMNIDIPEFFLCSPEYPLYGWNGGPLFDSSDENDGIRVSVYDRLSDGELDYARFYNKIFGRYKIPFDYWSVVKWSRLSVAAGSRYRREMKKIMWASNPDHSDYVPLVTGSLSIRQIMKKILIGAIARINKE